MIFYFVLGTKYIIRLILIVATMLGNYRRLYLATILNNLGQLHKSGGFDLSGISLVCPKIQLTQPKIKKKS